MTTLKKIQNIAIVLRLCRLAAFGLTSYCVYAYLQNYAPIYAVLGTFSLISFLFLYQIHQKYIFEERFLHIYLWIEKSENERTHNYTPLQGDSGLYFQNLPFVKDLQLFGEKSLFSAIDRTQSIFGKNRLKNLMVFGAKNVLKNQAIITELRDKKKFRYSFQALLHLAQLPEAFPAHLNNFFQKNAPRNNSFWRIYPFVSIAIFALGIASYYFTKINLISSGLGFLFIIHAFIFFSNLKKLQKELILGEKITEILRYYLKIIDQIGQQKFEQAQLIQLQEEIITMKMTIERFLSLMNNMQIIYNLFGAIIFNGFSLFSLKVLNDLRNFKRKQADQIVQFFENIGEFETYNSLANFYDHNDDFVFPSLSDAIYIKASNLKHPLISQAKGSDFELKQGQIVLLTGANMSGKSTFLKTLGINILMMKMGLPTAADQLTCFPFDIATFMQNADDLNGQKSYFLSEILQLKAILHQIEINNPPAFILLDEILKGTNSEDKLLGSQRFIEKLIDLKATGILATHDLVLTELAKKYPDKILNFHFTGEILENDVVFDYTLKKGVCKDKNALFLMQKWGVG